MSTSAQISPAWKQEVNRRLAEHRGRKGTSPAESAAPMETPHNASRRAMEAAARVAARYANAPSYSEVLAADARAALRAAEAASRAALQAQAAAQSVLDGIEAAGAAAPAPELPLAPFLAPSPELSPSDGFTASDDFFNWQRGPAESQPDQFRTAEPGPELVDAEAALEPELPTTSPDRPVSIRWDAGLPMHQVEPIELHAGRGQDLFETGAEGWWRPAAVEPDQPEPEPIEVVEPAQPIPANLIEFPRELVATRKARPRLAEAPHAAPEVQLSIFEVDPVSLPTEPEIDATPEPAQDWTTPTWSGMELEAHPVEDSVQLLEEPAPQPETAPGLQPAPASRRLLAIVVDGALIAGSLVAAATLAATRASALPGLHATEIGLGLGLIVLAGVYEALFFTLGRTTPGMKYAQIGLVTFEGLMPDRARRCTRLAALLVSALPMGFGLAWSLFDDDHLSWHDRLSRTYLCRR